MIGSGKTVGLVLMGVSAALLLVFSFWVLAALAGNETTSAGAALGLLLALLVMGPLSGAGAYLFRRGGQEQREYAQVAKKNRSQRGAGPWPGDDPRTDRRPAVAPRGRSSV
jgi:hypothetical protein